MSASRTPAPESRCDPPFCFADAPKQGCRCRLGPGGPFDLQVSAQIRVQSLGGTAEETAFAARFVSELRRFLGRKGVERWRIGDLERFMAFRAPELDARELALAGELLALVEGALHQMHGGVAVPIVVSSDSDSARLHPSLADTQLPWDPLDEDEDFLSETLARLDREGK